MAHLRPPSDVHVYLVQAIVDQLEKKGYRVTEAAGIRGYKNPTPTGRHAPDVKAYHPITRQIAIGEAKRLGDIQSEATHEQFWDFANAFHRIYGTAIPCYFAVARHGLIALQSELSNAGVDYRRENVHILTVGIRDPSVEKLPVSARHVRST